MKIDDVYLFVLKIWHETRRTDGDISHSLSTAEVNKISKKTQAESKIAERHFAI